MAVAEMSKLNLIAMAYDKDALFNALQRTGATEIKQHFEAEDTRALCADCESLKEYLARTESALELLSLEIDNYNKEHKIKSDGLKDGFTVTYTEFITALNGREQADEAVEKIYALDAERKKLSAERARDLRALHTAEIYSVLEDGFSSFSSTAHTEIKLGTVALTELDELLKALEAQELCAVSVLNKNSDSALVLCACHRSADIDGELSSAGFVVCPFKEGSGKSVYGNLQEGIARKDARIEEIKSELVALDKLVKPLKVYCDRLGFELEKKLSEDKLRATETTFLLEAYVPKPEEENVAKAIDEVSGAVYYEFSEPSEDEIPPTLYKNNKVVENFETITNMYSPVNSREFDPNTVMAFFYSVFLGFIMGDIGYGLLMLLGGGFIYMKKRGEDSGLKRLSGVFAVGGIFAIVWGLLFNSLFGIKLEFMPTVLPDARSDMWSFMGIKVPAMLVVSLEIGVIHLLAGYVCKAIQCMRRGRFWDGILDGLVWVIFSAGVWLAVIGLIDEAEMPLLAYIGGGMAGVSLVVAIFTAGRKEKLLGKFTKGFGTAYGIINYASDVLSYARLYGLMLSGAVIAQIVSDYSAQFVTSGNAGLVILAVILMIVGHLFNLAIGLLGAYIHDARLQYVEFYGRFYEGEGELFAPLGSNHKFIKLNKGVYNQNTF